MDNKNNPKHIEGKEWIHNLLDEELSDEAYKFELISDKTEQLAGDHSAMHTAYEKSFDSTEAWSLFKNHIQTKEDTAIRLVSLRSRWLKYAAIIAVPLLVGSIAYLTLSNHHEKPDGLYEQGAMAAPANKVILVLENGTSIDLKDTQQTTVLDHNIVNSAHQLDYSNNSTADVAAFNTLIVPKGNAYKLVLDDGTQVWLNADTKIRYQVNFDKTPIREVYLESGEAFFKVTKNPHKPFIVHKGDMKIQVLGTSFNINTYSGSVQTTLVEGKVKVELKNTSKELTLSPGQQANANLLTNALTKQNVDPYLFSAWKDGILIFDNITMETLMEQLGRLYDYNIVFENEQLKNLHYNGSTEKSGTLKPLLDIIEKTTNVKFIIKDRRIIVKRDN